MNRGCAPTLRSATAIALAGLVYVGLHKGVHAAFPALAGSGVGRTITSVLWLASASTLILFAVRFLDEVSPRDRGVRYALLSIVAFTGLLIVSRLPLGPLPAGGIPHRLVFGLARLGNAVAVVIFLTSLLRSTGATSPLRPPIRAAIAACGLSAVLGIVSFGTQLNYALTGREASPPPVLAPIAVLAFALTWGSVGWFLVRFRRVDDYRIFAGR
jgi:hypothetical protein